MWFALFAACGSEPSGPTWHQDVAPILAARCGSCHVDGGSSFSLFDYDTVAVLGAALYEVVDRGDMPPWGATGTDACVPRVSWEHDPRLDDDELDLLHDWIEAGLPEGDEAAAAELVFPEEQVLEPVSQTLMPNGAHALDGSDEAYLCTVLDPGFTESTWLTGLALSSSHPEAVHHALWFVERNGQALEQAAAGESYECFGATGRFPVEILGGMLPGTPVVSYPDGAGMRLEPGDVLVQQIHYTPSDGELVTTGVQLRTTTDQPALNAGMVEISESGNPDDLQPGPSDDGEPEFRIPAGASGHSETFLWEVPDDYPDLHVRAVLGHMHLAGTELEYRVHRAEVAEGEDADDCLLGIGAWDFEWQRLYWIDDGSPELYVRGGDTLELGCIYDNTDDNEALAAARADEGAAVEDIVAGNASLDEMCVGTLIVTYEGDPIPNTEFLSDGEDG